MSDKRSKQEIEDRARQLHYIFLGGDERSHDLEQIRIDWDLMTEEGKRRWEMLARSVRHVLHFDSATSGGWPTSPQADTIHELREQYKNYDNFSEQSLIGTTRPYGEMVVIFSWTKPAIKGPISRGFLIHPDGHYEDLHKEKVPDSYIKKEG